MKNNVRSYVGHQNIRLVEQRRNPARAANCIDNLCLRAAVHRSVRWAWASLFLLLVVLFSPVLVQSQSTLTLVATDPVDSAPGEPGPGDNMIFSVRRNANYIVSLSFTTGQPGEAVSHRVNNNGTLDPVGRTPAGREPRQIASARNGDYAVIVNSIDNEIVTMTIGDDGLLREINRVPSGGINPYDVAVAHEDIVVVANRDSDRINTFHIDRRGRLLPLSQASTGVSPHVVSVTHDGLVAVSNQIGRSVSIFEVNRRGELTHHDTVAVGNMIPGATAWHGRRLFVALDAPGLLEDVIRAFDVNRRVGANPNNPSLLNPPDEIEVVQGADTPAGHFLTDLDVPDFDAGLNMLFAATANLNGGGAAARDEIRAYRIENNQLILDAAMQTPGFPPSFKQISTGCISRIPQNGGSFSFCRPDGTEVFVFVTEFQAGRLRSLKYSRQQENNPGLLGMDGN